MNETEQRIIELLQMSKEILPGLVADLPGAAAGDQIAKKRAEAKELTARAYANKLAPSFPLDAKEAERRADRLMVLAVLKGRKDGTIETTFDARRQDGRGDKRPVSDFLPRSETQGKYQPDSGARRTIWMLGEISDELWERCIAQARKEKLMSRDGVLRIVAAHRNGTPTATQTVVKQSNRSLVTNSIDRMRGIEDLLGTVTALSDDIDQPTAERLLKELRSPLSTLNRIQRLLKNRAEL